MERALTKRSVDAAAVSPGASETWLWDPKLQGFGLRVRSGDRKDYFFKYGAGRRGKSRKVLIGRHGKGWTADKARGAAKRLQGEHAEGTDPGDRKAQERRLPTVAELAARYLSDYAEPHKKPRTVIEDRALLGLDARRPRTIAAELGGMRVDKVTGDDATRFHLSLRTTPTRANRALALLSHMFTMAEKWKILPFGSNPCRGVERFKEKKRERFLSLEELARVGVVLDAAERLGKAGQTVAEGGENPFAIAAVRLLIFTGCRLSEILAMRWSDVDIKRGTLRIPEPKEGKPKTVVLNAPAAKVFASLPRLEGNPFVIAGRKEGEHLTDLEHPWMRLRTKAGLEGVRLHDLRHSFASVAVAGGASLPIIGALLGHSQPQTTARYAHLSADPLRAASEAIGAQLAAAMAPRVDAHSAAPGGPGSKRGEVLPMRRRGTIGA